ncbi:MAG: GNAT family N-acetyltransferase, partial [Cyclobacteriaceae bacterium]
NLIPLLRQESVSQCVLEVITQNKPAIRVYNQLGFKENRYLKCFRSTKNTMDLTTNHLEHVEIRTNTNPDLLQYKSFGDHRASFQDSYSHIEVKSALETAVEASIDGQLVGYVIYQKPRGRISQIAVAHNYRRRGIGQALIRHIGNETEAKGLNIINVDVDASGVIKFLENCGFENYLDQYEMVKKI